MMNKKTAVKIVSGESTTMSLGNTILNCVPAVVLMKSTWFTEKRSVLGLSAFVEKSGNLSSWAPSTSNNRVVQCYRAIRLLSNCTEISDDTLCACYYVMSVGKDDESTRNIYLQRLKESGVTNVESIRKEILSEKIPDDVIDKIIGALIASGTKPDTAELCAELELRHINKTPQVETALAMA